MASQFSHTSHLSRRVRVPRSSDSRTPLNAITKTTGGDSARCVRHSVHFAVLSGR